MISFHLNNPFIAERISNDNFNKYSSTHIERLTAGIPVPADTLYGVAVSTIFNTMITDTQACYNTWKSTVDIKAAETSQKEGRTISVDDSISEMKAFISRKEGVIADKYPNGSPVYEEFFPHGKTEYTTATKKSADTLFKRFNTALENHKSDFDPAALTEANEKYNNYLALRKAQLQSMGKVKEGMTDSDEKRYKLGVQLYKNLLTLLLIYAEEPDKAANFFDESILKKKANIDEPPAPAQN